MNLKKLAGRSEFMYQSSCKGREMDSSMDKVLTVIVPVYNMEKYIRQCLESLVIGEALDRFEDIADKAFIKMHSMTIRTELARPAGRKIDENCYYVDVESVMYPITEVEPSLSGTGGIKQGIRKSRIVLYSFYSDFSTLTSRELSSGIIIQNRTNSPSRHWKEEQSRIIMPCLMQASNTS